MVMYFQDAVQSAYSLNNCLITIVGGNFRTPPVPIVWSKNVSNLWGSGIILIEQTGITQSQSAFEFTVVEARPLPTESIPPVQTKDNKVIFDTKRMIVGKSYRYMDKGKPYVAIKDKDNSVDIYKVHNR